MGYYRKKPVMIQAFQWNEGEPWVEGMQVGAHGGPVIKTLEGEMIVTSGDYIITGIKGEQYPCKPVIFEATYEELASDDRWDKAIENARFMLEEYKHIPSGIFGATAISLAISRYDNGERTSELLDELESIN